MSVSQSCFMCGQPAEAGSRLEMGKDTYALCADDTEVLTENVDLIWQWVRARLGMKRVHREGECPCGAAVKPGEGGRLRIGSLHVTLCPREAALVKASLNRLGAMARAMGLRGLIAMGKTMFLHSPPISTGRD